MAKRGSHTILVLPDLHVPEHDPAALAVVMAVARKVKPRRIVILGDWLECASFSSHPRTRLDAVSTDFTRDELEPCAAILDKLQEHCNHMDYIEGNHEARVRRCAANSGEAMRAAFSAIDPGRYFSRGRRRFTWTPYHGVLPHVELSQDLWAFHGWSTAKSAADKHAQSLKGKSGVYGHTHRLDYYADRIPGSNRVQRVWSPGCLRTLQPDWCHSPTAWAHGFSLIYMKNDETRWTPYTVEIDRGTCVLPSGETVRG